MDIFGHTSTPRIISLDYTANPFEIYNKISRNYTHSFLFESLTGPEELAETSIMGFDPESIVKGYFDKVTIEKRDGSIKTILTNDPLNTIKELVLKTNDQSYRYLGGAVGKINYDAIRLWEKIPKNHAITEPIMEFGIYTDGILFDNKQKKTLYFYYDENRINKIENLEAEFEEFCVNTSVPAFQKNFPGMELYYLKGDRGARKGKYAEILSFESVEKRDYYFPTHDSTNAEIADEFWKMYETTNVESFLAEPATYTDYFKVN